MSHPAVQAYKDNKARFDEDYFISFVKHAAEANPHLAGLRDTKEYQSFIALRSNTAPFGKISGNLEFFDIDDLTWLADNMPSGYICSRVMDMLTAREHQRAEEEK